jgi:hypothetical protein
VDVQGVLEDVVARLTAHPFVLAVEQGVQNLDGFGCRDADDREHRGQPKHRNNLKGGRVGRRTKFLIVSNYSRNVRLQNRWKFSTGV